MKLKACCHRVGVAVYCSFLVRSHPASVRANLNVPLQVDMLSNYKWMSNGFWVGPTVAVPLIPAEGSVSKTLSLLHKHSPTTGHIVFI